MFALVVAVSQLPFWHGFFQAAIFGAFTSLFPILFIVYLLKKGKITDLHISNTSERHIPYLVGIAGAVLAYFILRSLGSPPLLLSFVITDMLALAVLAIINVFWLISAHMTSIAIIVVFAGFAFSSAVSLALAPLLALTFYIRLFLKRHTIAQLVAGTLLGGAIVFGLAACGAFH
jgi:hypothetical protein